MSPNSLFLLSAILVALAAFIWRAQPSSPVNRSFAAYTASMAAWIAGIAGLQTGLHLNFWGRFSFAAASLIPAVFLAFTRFYPTISDWPSQRTSILVLWAGSFLAFASLVSPFVIYDVTLTPHGITRSTGPLYRLFSLYFIVVWIAALTVFTRKWRRARGLAKAQLQHLGLGLIISGFGGIGSNLLLPMLTGRSTYSWLGPYFTLALVLLVAHAIIRHRLMDLRLIIHRGLTYLMTVALLTGVLIWSGRTFVKHWRGQPFPNNQDLVLLGFALLLFLTSWGQQLIAAIFDRYLYRGRIDYSIALHNATHRLSHLLPPLELATTLHDIAAQSFVPESFIMFVRATTTAPFDCLLSSSMTPRENHDHILQRLAESLAGATSPSLIVLDPLHTGPNASLREGLRGAGIEIAMILGRRSNLLGVVFIGPRRSGDAYFTKDLTFLDSLTELASIALDNSLLYQQRIQMLEYSDRLLESIDSAVVAVDVHGRITSVNNAAKSLLGITDSARGLALDAVPSEVGWALALTIRSSAVIGEVEAMVEHPNRGTLPLILSTAVLHDHENHISGALVVATDISAIKALERNTRRVEHFATMARFYAGLAHEIRSPLASISNFISMLPDRFDDPEYRDTASRLLPTEVARIVRLADRVRLMAPSEHGELKSVELASLFSDIVTLHSPTAANLGIDIQLSCSADVPYIKGDPSQLVQLFTNLLNNAFEAMPSGGSIVIEVAPLSLQTSHDTIRVRVIDEGSGIPAGIESRLFEPFFTTKSSGTGLGLSICREIADFHHARLVLKRGRHGKGTVVEIHFPATSGEGNDIRTLQTRLQPSTASVESV